MDEFIVWDKTQKVFSRNTSLKDIKAYDGETHSIWLDDGADGIEIGDDLGYGKSNAIKIQDNLTFHNYISKTDTEGNKIYADCSIVEFDYYFGSSKYDKNTREHFIGYFSYNSDKLRYELRAKELEQDKSKFKNNTLWFVTFDENIETLKVIGTLQENKELLK